MFYKKNKIAVVIKGGLGNQLFQYYTALNLANKYNRELILLVNGYGYDNIRTYKLQPIFNGRLIKNRFKQYLTKKFYFEIYEKKDFEWQKIILEERRNYFLEGYWQNEKYFQSIRSKIVKQIGQQEPSNLFQKEGNSQVEHVAVHVRRGDYLNSKNINIHGVCDEKYYKSAISLLRKELDAPQFIFFSDDIVWCKKTFNNQGYKFSEKKDDWIDLLRMKSCDHFIISNSTYSWWAAWLNDNENKIVIAPKKWILSSELSPIPSNWIKL